MSVKVGLALCPALLLCASAFVHAQVAPSPEIIHAKRNGKAIELSLAALSSKSEADVLRDLTGVELTERMSTDQLQRWRTAMPGASASQALTALADTSVFLNSPNSRHLEAATQTPAMDAAAQQQLLARVNTYVDQTMTRLPNFFATQDVTTFEAIDGMRNNAKVIVHQPLRKIGTVTADVRYRNGKEVVETGKGEMSESDQVGYKLLFSSQFGPALNTVLADAQANKLVWSGWEARPGSESPSAAGVSSLAAVFRYSVPRKASRCKIKVVMPGAMMPLHTQPGYHGEIVVDPDSGAILRLTLIADLNSGDPMSAANLMIEYGPVELGGQTYICPVRSVTLETVNEADSNRPAVVTSSSSPDYGVPSHDTGMAYRSTEDVPTETLLNDLAFHNFQILRSESTVITGEDKSVQQN